MRDRVRRCRPAPRSHRLISRPPALTRRRPRQRNGRIQLPDHLRRFILTSVPSVPFLEAALLFRSVKDGTLSPTTLARRLYISDAAATEIVDQLRCVGIVKAKEPASADQYYYAPADAGLATTLDSLAAYYASHLIEVTQLIHSTNARRANEFADAFRLKKDR
jgi:hypothetical protein